MRGNTATVGLVGQVERLIAAARVALALFSLIALWLDPSEPGAWAAVTFYLIAGYLAVAASVLALVWAVPSPPAALGFSSHAFDLTMFGVVMALTHGPSSPFFLFFVFSLVSAALRWQWHGTLWTAAGALAILLGTGLWVVLVSNDSAFELNRFVIRCIYLIVIALLLGYLGDHEKQLRREVSRMSAVEERIRFARDLHDGTIQSLTGAALRLRALPELIETDREAALRTAAEVGDLLHEEQQTLREFVQSTREGGASARRPLTEQLAGLAGRAGRDWGLRVTWTAHACDALAPRLLDAIPRLLAEALANSARHGQASRVRLSIDVRDGRVALVASDNGRGFPFEGRQDSSQLRDRGLGPVSLMNRVAALGGALTIDSSERGARLEISLPLSDL